MYLQIVNQGNIKYIGNYSFNPRNCLGQGSYGKVYEGHETTTNQKVAIKQMDLRNFERDNYLRKQLSVEIEVLKRLRHKNVVRLIDLLQTQNSLYIITEFCQDGDLRDLITRKRFTEQEAVNILFQLIDGFSELWRNGIIHRDVKPANILQQQNVFKIADFGFAKFVDNFNTTLLRSCVGSPLYMAPQLLLRQTYTTKCDIWSLGVIFYEMLFGETPWKGIDERDLLNNILNKPLVYKKKVKIGKFSDEFLRRSLTLDEKDRISWEELFDLRSLMEKKEDKGIMLIKANKSPMNDNFNMDFFPAPAKIINDNKVCQPPPQKANSITAFTPNNMNLNNNAGFGNQGLSNRNNVVNVPKKPCSAEKNSKDPNFYVKFLNTMRQDLIFKHFVAVQVYQNNHLLRNFFNNKAENGGCDSTILDKFLVVITQLIKNASKMLEREISEKENKKVEMVLTSKDQQTFMKLIRKEAAYYCKFYEDVLDSLKRSGKYDALKTDKEMTGVIDGDLDDMKRENAAGLLRKYGFELLRKINKDVKKIALEEEQKGRESLVCLDYIVDFMNCIRRAEKNKEIDYPSIHREKAESIELNKYCEKIMHKTNYILQH